MDQKENLANWIDNESIVDIYKKFTEYWRFIILRFTSNTLFND